MANIATTLQQLTNQFSNQIEDYKRTMQGGKRAKPKATKPRLHEELQQLQQQQLQQFQQLAGNVKVYTGPKQGKFIINKHGKKVYIDRKGLKNDIPYNKKVVKRKAAKAAKAPKAVK
jgi:hypothetical protein